MTVDIQIDRLTDCLVERETGNVVGTKYVERNTTITKKECRGWKFDWSTTQKNGHTGKFEGIGGHLFAIACQISFEAGCDGFVAFTAKTNLVEYYKRTLKAQIIKGNRMYLDEEAANILIDKYIRK